MYNPLSANKPKLVWDFLRSYRNRTKPLNPKQEKLEAPIVEEPLTDPPQTVVTEDSNAPIESNVKSQASPEYHSRSQSIVDMSKMTGRT